MIRSLFAALFLALVLVHPASAHKLKVFAAVKGDTIAGYAFFIGGGRAQNTDWAAKDGAGTVLSEGQTSTEGEFSFSVPESIASDITITVNTKEGHIASKTLAADRFGVATESTVPATATETAASNDPPVPSGTSQMSEKQMTALIEAAVQRQVEPLLERIEEMDSRLRFADILSGLFLIAGLAGMGLWAYGRKK